MLEEIIRQLGDNYDTNDNQLLEDLIDEITYSALSFTNRKSSEEVESDLKDNIKRCVIAKYLQRGGEGSNSLNELGKSASFYDPVQRMYEELIQEGKRRIC